MATTKSNRGGRRAGAGRPKVYAKLGRPISVRLEEADQAALDAKCERLGIARTKGLQEAVAKWVRTKR